jgi:ectoine hydroxylase-related dioxygenase (phytanoyl-CoA dioxygenase family)
VNPGRGRITIRPYGKPLIPNITSVSTMNDALFQTPYEVTDEQVAFYQDNGYVRLDDVLSLEEVEAVRAALERAMEARAAFNRDLAGGGDKILQMLNLWEHDDVLKAYSTSPRLAGIAKRLTGSSTVHLFHDQALVKKPGPSAPSPWHQDQPYWPSKEPCMLSCWMALDDVTEDRGAMQFIPGSHKWGEFAPIEFSGEGAQLPDLVPDEQKPNWKPVVEELKAGSCTWHHGLTAHYTRPNTTPHTRRALVTIYIPEGVTFAAEEKMEHPLSDTITSRKGEPLRGSKFLELA